MCVCRSPQLNSADFLKELLATREQRRDAVENAVQAKIEILVWILRRVRSVKDARFEERVKRGKTLRVNESSEEFAVIEPGFIG